MSKDKPKAEVEKPQAEPVKAEQAVATAEPKKGNGKFIFLGCIGIVLCSAVLCCITFFVMVVFMPAKLLGMFVSNEPLDIVQPAPWSEEEVNSLMERVGVSMQAGESVSLTGEEITQLMGSKDPNMEVFSINATEDDMAVVDLSYKMEGGKYMNVHVVGDIEISDGSFSKFLVEELTVGSFDIGQLLKGKDMAADINTDMQSDPSTENPIKDIEYFGIVDGVFQIKLSPGYFDAPVEPYPIE